MADGRHGELVVVGLHLDVLLLHSGHLDINIERLSGLRHARGLLALLATLTHSLLQLLLHLLVLSVTLLAEGSSLLAGQIGNEMVDAQSEEDEGQNGYEVVHEGGQHTDEKRRGQKAHRE